MEGVTLGRSGRRCRRHHRRHVCSRFLQLGIGMLHARCTMPPSQIGCWVACTTRKRPTAGEPKRPIAGAPRARRCERAGDKWPLPAHQAVRRRYVSYCRRTTQASPAKPNSTGARAAAPAVGLPALAHATCAGSRAFRCAGNYIRKFILQLFSSILQYIFDSSIYLQRSSYLDSITCNMRST
jgi:hypothetical protein